MRLLQVMPLHRQQSWSSCLHEVRSPKWSLVMPRLKARRASRSRGTQATAVAPEPSFGTGTVWIARDKVVVASRRRPRRRRRSNGLPVGFMISWGAQAYYVCLSDWRRAVSTYGLCVCARTANRP